MDQATKEQFKWKFYRLVVILNLIVLIVAIGFVALFKAPEDYRIPAFFISILAALLTAWHFQRQYRETRAWLLSRE
jgi:hypothetical protein